MILYSYQDASPEELFHEMASDFVAFGGNVTKVGDWQALDVSAMPQGKTIELRNAIFEYQMPQTYVDLAVEIEPNMPWAEDHFQERVSGQPLNPGEQYKNWPWYRGNVETHRRVEEKFSHTYMERFWPKRAWKPSDPFIEGHEKQGIRYPYGDLDDLVTQLARTPDTRQAYLPVWFPEDTGAVHGERVPCTLGYHFLLRENRLHVTYFIRSCDFLRHFRDDVYLAARLCQWVLEKVRWRDFDGADTQRWEDVKPGVLTMHMVSFHVFEGDLPMMRRKLRD